MTARKPSFGPFVMYAIFFWIGAGGCGILYFELFDLYVSGSVFAAAFVGFCAVYQYFTQKNGFISRSFLLELCAYIVPIEMFFVMLFAQKHFIAAVLILLGLLGVNIVIYKLIIRLYISENVEITYRYGIWKRSAALNCLVAVVVLLAPAGIGITEEYSAPPSINVELPSDLEYTVDADNAVIQQLCRWDELDDEDKKQLIYTVGQMERKSLGIADDVTIDFYAEKIDEYVGGSYSNETRTLTINIDRLANGTLEENIGTLTHEMFHAYQHYMVETTDFESPDVQSGYYYITVRAWKHNLSNYVSGKVDYDAYYSQPLEADAFAYSAVRTKKYMDVIASVIDRGAAA